MSKRGLTRKTKTERAIILERAMVTRHYLLSWDLDRCVGCQIGPLVCPKEAITLVEGRIEQGRLVQKPSVDIDPEKCVLCGMCEVVCPKRAISLTINGRPENPVLAYEAFPELTPSITVNKNDFDPERRDFIIKNCPSEVIRYQEEEKKLVVDEEYCIHCRQCEIASHGAFQVQQSWEGRVELRRGKCLPGCLTCADVCPTRALHIDENGELALADYYCIKCGACLQVCPVRPEYESQETLLALPGGNTSRVTQKRITNPDKLPLSVERWRVHHTPVKSAAWIEALAKMADDKAGMVEMDRKRALQRRDLLKALPGYKTWEIT